MKMKLVKDFHAEIVEKEGQEISNKFLELMQYWNDGKNAMNHHFSEPILLAILEEAKKKVYPVKAYKFAETATSIQPDILQTVTAEGFIKSRLTPEKFLEKKYNGELNIGIENLKNTGQYKIMGWAFDFRPFMKKYVVKQYGEWKEYWAPNKTLLRKSKYGKIDKIIEIPK